MSKCKTIALIALIAAFLLVPVTQAVAETMKHRIAWFHTKAEIIEVGDVEGHIVGVGESTGLVSFDTGEVASAVMKWTVDYTKGNGIHRTYTIMTFEDGSTIVSMEEGSAQRGPKGSRFEGKIVISQGSGRFAGIQGKGTYTGRRILPIASGVPLYVDRIVTYTLP